MKVAIEISVSSKMFEVTDALHSSSSVNLADKTIHNMCDETCDRKYIDIASHNTCVKGASRDRK